MVLTVAEAIELTKNKGHVRQITVDELYDSNTTPGTIHPADVLRHFLATINGYEQKFSGRITEPVIMASHPEILGVDNESLTLNTDGSPQQDFFRGREADEEVTISVAYKRISVKVNVGPEEEYQDTLGFLYAIDRNRFVAVAGKTVTICNNMNVFSSDHMFKGNSKDISNGLKGLDDYLFRFEEYSEQMTRTLEAFKRFSINKPLINEIIADNHYISSKISENIRKGVRQVLDDATMKRAHYLLWNTIHPYRLLTEEEAEEPYYLLGTVYQMYNCFTESLGDNDKDLTKSFDKALNIFQYFRDFVEKKWNTRL